MRIGIIIIASMALWWAAVALARYVITAQVDYQYRASEAWTKGPQK